jgi:hypothetical protein
MADAIEAIGTAATVLAEHGDPAVQAVGAWLSRLPGDLVLHLAEVENGVGISARRQLVLAKRDEILRGISGYASIARLAKDIDAYWTRCWSRDRTLRKNPYPAGDNRAKFFDMFRLHPAPLSRSQIYTIVRSDPY